MNATASETKWTVGLDEDVQVPMTTEQIRHAYDRRRLALTTPLWREGMENWATLEQLAGELGIETVKAPAQPPRSSDALIFRQRKEAEELRRATAAVQGQKKKRSFVDGVVGTVWSLTKWIFCGFVLLIIIGVWANRDGPSGGIGERQAKRHARVYLEGCLISPATVDYVYEQAAETPTGWEVSGALDSDNLFGAKVRTFFTIHLGKQSEGFPLRNAKFDGDGVNALGRQLR